jgi:hypothetical protein
MVMARGRMDEEVVKEREPSARGRGGEEREDKDSRKYAPPLLPSSRQNQRPTRISPSPVNPLRIRIRRSRREIDATSSTAGDWVYIRETGWGVQDRD